MSTTNMSKSLAQSNFSLSGVAKATIGAGALALAPAANAALVTVTDLNQNIAPDSVYNLAGMSGVSIEYDTSPDYNAKLYSRSGQVTNPLAEGTVFGPGFSTGVLPDNVKLTLGANAQLSGVFGVVFDDGAGPQYGWVDIATTSVPLTNLSRPYAKVVLNGYGYNDEVNQSVVIPRATRVNAPAGLAILALGAAGMGILRRRTRSA